MISRCAGREPGMAGGERQPGAVHVVGHPDVGRRHDQDVPDRIGADPQGGLDLDLVADDQPIQVVERAAVGRPMPADHGISRLTRSGVPACGRDPA